MLIYSNDTYLNNNGFLSWLTTKGINWTVNESATNFGSFNAVLTEGNASMDAAALAAYVQAGGNVMDIGGTGIGGAVAEAAYSNAFLNNFGLAFKPVYNNLGPGPISTAGFDTQGPFGAALFTGVQSVYANNGNDVLTATAAAGVTNQIFLGPNGGGTFGAASLTATPEPASMTLVATGLAGMAGFLKRRKKNGSPAA